MEITDHVEYLTAVNTRYIIDQLQHGRVHRYAMHYQEANSKQLITRFDKN